MRTLASVAGGAAALAVSVVLALLLTILFLLSGLRPARVRRGQASEPDVIGGALGRRDAIRLVATNPLRRA